MKKIIIFSFLATTLVALLFISYSILKAIDAVSRCIYISQTPKRIILIGKVNDVRKEDKVIIANFRLCGNTFLGMTNVRIFIPELNRFIYAGQSGETGYSWNRIPIDLADSILDKNNLLAVPVEEMESVDQIRNGMTAGSVVPCEDIPQCQARLNYYEKYGEIQKSFVLKIRNKAALSLWLDFLLGRTAIFSDQFGKIDSIDSLKQLVEKSNF